MEGVEDGVSFPSDFVLMRVRCLGAGVGGWEGAEMAAAAQMKTPLSPFRSDWCGCFYANCLPFLFFKQDQEKQTRIFIIVYSVNVTLTLEIALSLLSLPSCPEAVFRSLTASETGEKIQFTPVRSGLSPGSVWHVLKSWRNFRIALYA